ncbi:MAG: hypothetical protein KGD58_12310 [Candidatus Lokiarchaeota archaeon]|nr:hypothetical protein [Candidatus Lokiarchaeota archaeon]
MGWTPPTKITVIIAFLLMAFGVYIIIDLVFLNVDGLLIDTDFTIGDFSLLETWMLIAVIVIFLSWFIFFLGVKLAGM